MKTRPEYTHPPSTRGHRASQPLPLPLPKLPSSVRKTTKKPIQKPIQKPVPKRTRVAKRVLAPAPPKLRIEIPTHAHRRITLERREDGMGFARTEITIDDSDEEEEEGVEVEEEARRRAGELAEKEAERLEAERLEAERLEELPEEERCWKTVMHEEMRREVWIGLREGVKHYY